MTQNVVLDENDESEIVSYFKGIELNHDTKTVDFIFIKLVAQMGSVKLDSFRISEEEYEAGIACEVLHDDWM